MVLARYTYGSFGKKWAEKNSYYLILFACFGPEASIARKSYCNMFLKHRKVLIESLRKKILREVFQKIKA